MNHTDYTLILGINTPSADYMAALDAFNTDAREFWAVEAAYGAKLASYRDYVEAYKAYGAAHEAFHVAYRSEQLNNPA